jgi:FtsP/CotA-like multicopper oxidase with cupredoxin domain
VAGAGRVFSRRAALLGAAAGLAGLAAGSSAGADDDVPYLPSTAKDQPFLPNLRFQGYHSPRNIRPFIDDLPILPRRRLGGHVVAAEALHEFHSDMPPAPSWGFDGVSHLGPVIEAQRGEVTKTTFVNGLGRHVMADYVDLSLHGVVPEDIDRPPLVVHLHGAPNSPVDDGYPTAIIRPGQYIDYTFGNDLEAAPLWYHDHSMGSTRLSLYAGAVLGPRRVRHRRGRQPPWGSPRASTRCRWSSATRSSPARDGCGTTVCGPTSSNIIGMVDFPVT